MARRHSAATGPRTGIVPLTPTIGRRESSASRHAPGQWTGRQGPGPPRVGPGLALGDRRLVAVVLIVLFIGSGMFSRSSAKAIGFSAFQHDLATHQVQTANFNNTTGAITGTLVERHELHHDRSGPAPRLVLRELRAAGVKYTFSTPSSNALGEILIYLLPVALIIGFFVWMSRRAQGQMSGIMSIGRSQGQGVHGRTPADDLRRRGRLPGRQTGDQ